MKIFKFFLFLFFFILFASFLIPSSYATHSSCTPTIAVSCNPPCGETSTCGKSTTCIDNCGHTFTGQCSACPTPVPTQCIPTSFTCTGCSFPCSGSFGTQQCYDNCGNFLGPNACFFEGCTPPICTINEENCGPCSKTCGGGTKNCVDSCGKVVPQSCNNQACGVTSQAQECRGGEWVNVGSPVCVSTCTPSTPAPLPACNKTASNCGSCSAACGNGVKQCQNIEHTSGNPCTPSNTTEPCSQICPPGQSCVAQACVTNYTIAGNVFVDINANKIKDAGESNYTGSITITSTGGTVTTSAGSYTVSNTTAGSYTVSYTSLPTSYEMTYPLNGPPPSFSVSVGPSCSTGGSNSASCTSGSIINLNYGINNLTPWIQGIGASLRLDSGFTSKIPQSSQCGSYASIPSTPGGTPGLIFTGSSTPDFGQGSASQNPYNWVVGGPTYPNLYAPTRQGGVIKTSYNYVLSRARQGSITPTDLSSFCTGGISNCSLSSSIPHGVYIANGNLRLNSFTFSANQNYVVLVTGDLTILGKIFVPTTSTALFSASGDIRVDRSVGEGSFTSTTSSIEGIYSADRSFIVEGTNNCTVSPDIRFNVAGSVIVNGALLGGSFQNLRNLCGGNVCPAFSVKERPDFILNTPDFLRQPNFTYQELAP